MLCDKHWSEVYGLIFVLENGIVQSDDRKKAIAFTGTKTNKLSQELCDKHWSTMLHYNNN